jgi:hypothetical protein
MQLARGAEKIAGAAGDSAANLRGRVNRPLKSTHMKLEFVSKILIRGINPYLRVSASRASSIKPGWRKPMPIRVCINGRPRTSWRVNMIPTGDGSFCLYLHGDIRKTSAINVGDRVKVAVWFDSAYRNGPMHPMPGWFRAALARAPRAKKAWDLLVPSRKKEILRYFSRLKSEDARARNLQRALHVLSGASGRFMAREWKDGC